MAHQSITPELGLLTNRNEFQHNLSAEQLIARALERGEVQQTADGAILAHTGIHTGRSPHDKYIVQDAQTEGTIAWGAVNQPFDPAKFDALKKRAVAWLNAREVFVQDLYAGADTTYRLPISIVTTNAWHALFAQNMFIRPKDEQITASAERVFTVLHVPEFSADIARDGTRSETFVIINFTQKIVLIGGTSYAGEIKKSIFTVMNYLLPARGVLPMHASANESDDGNVAIFFGLSGTGKTTLSADASRTLIGDDEHGWSDNGVFNFEGGCYAKAIKLSAKAEPEIYAASRRRGTVLENVVMDPVSRQVDFDDNRLTENTRSSYPIHFIPNASATGTGGIPRNIIMLTCDAYGVLPPVSKLTPAQAMYHFLSGYTARVAGTEKGVTEPQATFSTCFGAPFMPRPPSVYADLLGQKIKHHEVACWLLNTGWSGGAYGTGERMPIHITRALLHAILSGSLANEPFDDDGIFGLSIPQSVVGLSSALLHPRQAWADKALYEATANKVIGLFRENFAVFAPGVALEIAAARMGKAA